jgi:hypothetical protein
LVLLNVNMKMVVAEGVAMSVMSLILVSIRLI